MEPGYVTVLLESSVAIHNLSYVWRSIKEEMGEEIDSKIQRLCLLKNSMGVCFDVKPETVKAMQDAWANSRRWKLSVLTELPELQESRRDNNGSHGRSFGGRGRGGTSFDRRGGGGNRRGGGGGGNRRGGFGRR